MRTYILPLLLFLIGCVSTTASNISGNWSEYTSAPVCVDGVFHITSAEELAHMALQVNNLEPAYVTGNFVLDSDIDLDGHYWIPIGRIYEQVYGTLTGTFKGTFDGKGHTISNMTVLWKQQTNDTSKMSNYGLFSYLNGRSDDEHVSVRNLVMKNAELRLDYSDGDVTSPWPRGVNIGIIAGGIFDNVDIQNIIINDCSINDGGIAMWTTSEVLAVGGAIGAAMHTESAYSTNTTAKRPTNISIDRIAVQNLTVSLPGYSYYNATTPSGGYDEHYYNTYYYSFVGGIFGYIYHIAPDVLPDKAYFSGNITAPGQQISNYTFVRSTDLTTIKSGSSIFANPAIYTEGVNDDIYYGTYTITDTEGTSKTFSANAVGGTGKDTFGTSDMAQCQGVNHGTHATDPASVATTFNDGRGSLLEWTATSGLLAFAACAHQWNKTTECTICHAHHDHTWVNGICTTCALVCEHSWQNAECTTCGKHCWHEWNHGTACSVCGDANFSPAVAPDNTGMTKDAQTWCRSVTLGINTGSGLEPMHANGWDNDTWNFINPNFNESWEGNWGDDNIKLSQEFFNAVAAAGIDAVRLPVRWVPHVEDYKNGKMAVDPVWMARVKEVVDYCVTAGLKVIINTHHEYWLEYNPYYAMQEKVNSMLYDLWYQIATEFRDYGEDVIFAGTNEVTADGAWGEPTEENQAVQNSYNQTFVNAVRATGGKNYYRNLVIQTYTSNWEYSLESLIIPTDVTADRLSIEFHFYGPHEFTHPTTEGHRDYWGYEYYDRGEISGTEYAVDQAFDAVRDAWWEKGYGVILGETNVGYHYHEGSTEEEKQTQFDNRDYWMQYVITQARRNGFPAFIWDDGKTEPTTDTNRFGLMDRKNNCIGIQSKMDAIQRGLQTPYEPTFTPSQPRDWATDDATTLWEGDMALGYGSTGYVLFTPQQLFDLDEDEQLVLYYTFNGEENWAQIHLLFDHNVSKDYPDFYFGATKYNFSFMPRKLTSLSSGSDIIPLYIKGEALAAVKERGLCINGHGVNLTKVVINTAQHTCVNDGNGYCTICGFAMPLEKDDEGYYLIYNAGHLAAFRDLVNSTDNTGKPENTFNARLQNDIDMQDYGDFGKAIGTSVSIAYNGTFDGQGHTISNLSISRSESNIGLFGVVGNATIKDFFVSGNVTTTATGQPFIGTIGQVVGKATIEDVHSSLNISSPNSEGKDGRYGGILGAANCWGATATIDGVSTKLYDSNLPITISRCSYNGTLNAGGNNGRIGGITGMAYNYTSITDCLFSGSITGTYTGDGTTYVGGIAAHSQYSMTGITNCLSCGTYSLDGTPTNFSPIIAYMGKTNGTNVTNVYSDNADWSSLGSPNNANVTSATTLKTTAELASGSVQPLLGQAWSQIVPTAATPANATFTDATPVPYRQRTIDDVTFDDDADDMPYSTCNVADIKARSITYTRAASYVKGYMSVCLPFALTQDMLPSASCKPYIYTSYDDNTVSFTSIKEVAAGQPCFIYVGTKEQQEPWTITLTADDAIPLALMPQNVTTGICGAFATTTIGTGYYKLNTEGTALNQTAATSLCYPYRAYIALPAVAAKTLRIAFDGEGQTTAISAPTLSTDAGTDANIIYDIAGRRVSNPKSGIYVVSGKRIVVK